MSLRVGLKLGSCASLVSLLATSTLLAQPNRIHSPIDVSRTVVLKGNRSAKALPQYDLGPVDASLELPYITLQLKPSPVQQSTLDRLLADQQSPSSPNYHKWLTPDQFGDRFGISSSDAARITAWLQSAGLQVNDVARGRHWVTFTGTAGRIASALHTEIHRYRVDGEVRRANVIEPSVPADLADIVAGIQGLDDFPDRSDRVSLPVDLPAFNSGASHYMSPDDFATIYHVDALYQAGFDGTGQKIAVIGRTNIDVADVRAFRTRFNLPVNDPQVVLVGPDPGISTTDQGEAYLDLEWAGAVARNATIIYVNSANVRTSAQYAVDQNLATVMTFSYGSCEQQATPAMRAVAQQAAAQGITWMASAGDSGANGCDPHSNSSVVQSTKGRGASFPASIPEITAVGGTMFAEGSGNYWGPNGTNSSSALSYIPEKAWNETNATRPGILSGGGGASIFFSKPAWQTGPGVPNDNARDLPDLSLAAALHDGYLISFNGTLFVSGGTSAASPAFAGIVALLNQYLVNNGSLAQSGLGNINPALYRLAQRTTDVFHDITTGNNVNPCSQLSPNCVDGLSGDSAGPNYDLVTGLGTIDAYHLATEWNVKTESTATRLTVSTATADLNGSVTLTAAVTAAGGTPSGAVSFTVGDNDTALGSASLSAGIALLTIPANLLPVGADTLWALYSGDANFNSSAGSAAVTIGVPAAGSVVVASVSPNPVYQNTVDLQSASWTIAITLRELAGVATTLTGFTIGGTAQPLTTFFPTTRTIAAKGVLSVGIVISKVITPDTATLGFTGADANGRTWSRQVVVTFEGAGSVLPIMLMRAPAGTVQQNPNADPACQWSQPVYLQEENGFSVQLTKFTLGTKDISDQIQAIFGATRLAPFGTLHGTVCWSGITAPQTVTSSIVGAPDIGGNLTATLSSSFGVGSPAPSTPSVSPTVIAMSVAGSSETATATTALSFEGGAPAWTAAVFPAGRTSSWLQVSPASGTGPATLTLKAAGTGLSNGVYNATIAIQAAGAVPQYLNVTVAFTVGAVSGVTIDAASNVFSGEAAFAPGMLIGIYGSQLSPSTQIVAALPLPLTNGKVSATVNGVSAPLYYISPGQFDIQIPYETGAGTAVLGINNNGKVASFTFPVTATAPGLWPHFLTLGGTLTTTAKTGDILVTFMTGDGDVTPSLTNGAVPAASTATKNLPQPRLPVSVTVGGVPATVLFAGITSSAPGVTQIDFTVPPGTPVGPGIPVVVTVGSVSATPVNLTIPQ